MLFEFNTVEKERCYTKDLDLKTENDMYQDHVILHFALFNLLGDDNLLNAFRI